MMTSARFSGNYLLLFLMLAAAPCIAIAQSDSIYLNVRILTDKHLYQVSISPVQGQYQINCRPEKTVELPQKTLVLCTAVKNKVSITKAGKILGSYDTVKIKCIDRQGILKIKAGHHEKKYDDELRIYSLNGQLRLINRVELEDYTSGVVLSEGGDAKNLEFFKLQCLISRTYALRNVRKHEAEGYQLCDQVHCQLYKGHSSMQDILDAVEYTRGLVIIGPDTQLISAAFHSNSGGETCNSENVWSLPSVYLKAVPDTFSLSMPMARWEKKIPKDQWVKNLKKKYDFPVNNKQLLDSALNFTQATRKTYYVGGIHLKELRNDFNLRSTFFDIVPEGDMLVLKGKGYGHGVGLSQEGAIKMAREGYSYTDILKFYYKDISIKKVDTALIPKKK